METTAYYAFGLPLFALLIAFEAWLARRRGRAVLSLADSVGNTSAGLGSITVGLALGPVLLALYHWAYLTFAAVDWAAGAWQPWLLALVLTDLGHYCHHRFDHRVAACWAVHGVHHQPEELNFTTGMRHAWFSDLYSFPFYFMLPLVGVPVGHFFVATTLLSLHALLTHSQEIDFPSFGILVTPKSHALHHAKNPRYVDKNLGAMFCVWDKLFGTHVRLDPDDPPVYGAHSGYKTHDGVLSQWVLWGDLLHLARSTPSWRDRLRVFVKRPGWCPPGVTPAPIVSPPVSESLSKGLKLYVLGQFALTCVLSLYVFILRDHHSVVFLALSAVFIFVSLSSLGGLLDTRPHARLVESIRVGVGVIALLGITWGALNNPGPAETLTADVSEIAAPHRLDVQGPAPGMPTRRE